MYIQDNKYKYLSYTLYKLRFDNSFNKRIWGWWWQLYYNRPGFVDDVIKTFGMFLVCSSNSCSLTTHEH